MMDNINFQKTLPPLSATTGVKRVKRREDQNQRQPFQKALQEKNKKKKKQKEEEKQMQPEDSAASHIPDSVTEFTGGEALTVDEDAVDRRRMHRDNSSKKLIDVHV